MVQVQIAGIPPDLKQRFPRRDELRDAEAAISVRGVPRYVGSIARSWGPLADRARWTVWDLEGRVCLTGDIERVDSRVLQLVRHRDEIVVLYGSKRSSLIRSEPTVEIAGREYLLPGNLRETPIFEFGNCAFRWRVVAGQPELHMSLAAEEELLAFVGFGYDLWKGAYFDGLAR